MSSETSSQFIKTTAKLLVAFMIIPFFLEAKTGEKTIFPVRFSGKKITQSFITEYESRFSGFFEDRIKGPKATSRRPALPRIRESDLLMLPRLWSRLSPEFKALYYQTIDIPDGYSVYPSPGGHFEVYYTLTDPFEAVDSTDTIGYGGSDWRGQVRGPNGVPDYVDEVAWALDSSWSLHVDRFGFIGPLPYRTNNFPSSRYKAVITRLGDDDYGYTFVMGKEAGVGRGFTSLFQVRNDWNGDTWKRLGYQDRPVDGVRVTCAHELFHAVQYAMTWDAPMGNDLDDFPLTFLEATAVLMEDIAFDSINDYLQYARYYFSDPRMSFFNNAGGIQAYSNSILAKFIYEKAGPSPSISFVRKMMFDNYDAAKEFHANLRAAATAGGISWPLLLNRFHAESFFSGTRGDTVRFIADAPLLDQWNYQIDTLPPSFSISKQVGPYAMQLFAFLKEPGHSDTLNLSFEGETGNQGGVPSPSWAVSCILRSNFSPDTIVPVPIGSDGKGWYRINDWGSRREVLVLPTNGHPTERCAMTVSLQPCPIAYRALESAVITNVAPDSAAVCSVNLTAKSDLRCPLSLVPLTGQTPSAPSTLLRLSPAWDLGYPLFWAGTADISLSLSVPAARIDSIKRWWKFIDDSSGLYRWSAENSRWVPAGSRRTDSGTDFVHVLDSSPPGIYCMFVSGMSPPDTSVTLKIFPNPGRLRSGADIHFRSADITEIRIYTAGGTLVRAGDKNSGVFRFNGSDYLWNLEGSSGKKVTPGTYIALVKRKDGRTGQTASTLNKILVFP
jgi:hypothetical protein